MSWSYEQASASSSVKGEIRALALWGCCEIKLVDAWEVLDLYQVIINKANSNDIMRFAHTINSGGGEIVDFNR